MATAENLKPFNAIYFYEQINLISLRSIFRFRLI